jgi:hypothetical protein
MHDSSGRNTTYAIVGGCSRKPDYRIIGDTGDVPSPRAGLGRHRRRRLWPREPLLVMADVDDFITAKPCDLFMFFLFFSSTDFLSEIWDTVGDGLLFSNIFLGVRKHRVFRKKI